MVPVLATIQQPQKQKLKAIKSVAVEKRKITDFHSDKKSDEAAVAGGAGCLVGNSVRTL